MKDFIPIYLIAFLVLFALQVVAAIFLRRWQQRSSKKIYTYIYQGYLIALGLFLSTFILSQLVVASCFQVQAGPLQKAEIIVVLGAGLKGKEVSNRLKSRLDHTLKYAELYPSLPIIVSGGQGPDEVISEAEAMETYLIKNGVAPERIIKEDQSTNTKENLEFSRRFFPSPNSKIILITSDYHLFRALELAKMQKIDAMGAAAQSPFLKRNNYAFREYLSLWKMLLTISD